MPSAPIIPPTPAPVPTPYKELKGWKAATPQRRARSRRLVAFYRDPKLAVLLKQVEISNQTVAAAAASYEQARALVRQAQAALFPHGDGKLLRHAYAYRVERRRRQPAAM